MSKDKTKAKGELPLASHATKSLEVHFPVWDITLWKQRFKDQDVLLVCGGGGSAKTGVPNKLLLLTFNEAEEEFHVHQELRSVHMFRKIAVHPKLPVIAVTTGKRLWFLSVQVDGKQPRLRQVVDILALEGNTKVEDTTDVPVLGHAISEDSPKSSRTQTKIRRIIDDQDDDSSLITAAWSPAGDFLAVGDSNGNITLWQPKLVKIDNHYSVTTPVDITQTLHHAFPASVKLPASLEAVPIHNKPSRVYVITWDSHLHRLWQESANKSVDVYLLASSHADGSVTVWQIPAEQKEARVSCKRITVTSAITDPKLRWVGRWLHFTGSDGSRVPHLTTVNMHGKLGTGISTFEAAQLTRDKQCLDGWVCSQRSIVTTLPAGNAVSRSSTTACVATTENLQGVDITTGKRMYTVPLTSNGAITSLALTSSRNTAICGDAGTIRCIRLPADVRRSQTALYTFLLFLLLLMCLVALVLPLVSVETFPTVLQGPVSLLRREVWKRAEGTDFDVFAR